MKTIIFACSVKKDLFRIIPIIKKLRKENNRIPYRICYCGPQINYNRFRPLYEQLEVPEPDFCYKVRGRNYNDQVASLSVSFEETVGKTDPALIIIPSYYYLGIAYATVGDRYDIPICLLDGGLRNSEELQPLSNYRGVIDSLASILFITEENSLVNLKNEHISCPNTFMTKNVMYDFFNEIEPFLDMQTMEPFITKDNYVLAYLYTNEKSFDDQRNKTIIEVVKHISQTHQIIFTAHSAESGSWVEKLVDQHGIKDVKITGRIEYPAYLAMLKNASFILTDSCNIQEEASFFNVPCISLQKSSERKFTEEYGTNVPVDFDLEKIISVIDNLFTGKKKGPLLRSAFNPGDASSIIAEHLMKIQI